jgi:hypothetical protein
MKNCLVVRDTLDQILIVDLDQSQVCLDEESSLYLERYFITDDCADYIGIHVSQIEDEHEAARILSEWASVSKNHNFVNSDVTVFEICTEETRYRVTRDMPDWIVCYVDYIDPLKDREPKPVEYQYINRRESDGALWPTFCPIQSEGWVQIGKYPIEGRHEVGDTVLVFDGVALPEIGMYRGRVADSNGTAVFINSRVHQAQSCINFSKGDHLAADEREAWHQEATGFQESYYESFNQ